MKDPANIRRLYTFPNSLGRGASPKKAQPDPFWGIVTKGILLFALVALAAHWLR